MKRPVKVLCPHCERLITLEHFRFEGSTLIITCARCGVESRLENVPAQAQAAQVGAAPARAPSLPPRVSLASTEGGSNVVVLRTAGHEAVQKAARAADENPFAVPEGVCPKCIAPRAAGEACPHCGIFFASFDETMVLPPKWLREEWTELMRDWGNEQKHQHLRRKAQQADALAAVGRLYRMRQSAVPEDPVAEEGRAEVVRMAAVAISFRPSQEGELERRKRTALIAVLSVITFLVALVLIRMMIAPR